MLMLEPVGRNTVTQRFCGLCFRRRAASGINKSTREEITQTWQLGYLKLLFSKKQPVGSKLAEADVELDIMHNESLLPSFCCSRFAISSLQAGQTWLPCVSL